MVIHSSKDKKFFALFEKQSNLNYTGALYLKDLIDYFKKINLISKSVASDEDKKWFIRLVHQIELSHIVHKIRDLKHEEKNIMKEFNLLLHKTLVTPIDSDDLYELSLKLMKVLNYIYSSAHRIDIYRAQETVNVSSRLVNILVSTTEESKEAFNILREMGNVNPHIEKVRLLERKGSEAYIECMSKLFQTGNEIEIIKWNDIYLRIRKAILACTKLSEMIRYLKVKYG
ncbi:MAG: DUF47 family protein [Candidatus Eremiobacterota bacterium]